MRSLIECSLVFSGFTELPAPHSGAAQRSSRHVFLICRCAAIELGVAQWPSGFHGSPLILVQQSSQRTTKIPRLSSIPPRIRMPQCRMLHISIVHLSRNFVTRDNGLTSHGFPFGISVEAPTGAADSSNESSTSTIAYPKYCEFINSERR